MNGGSAFIIIYLICILLIGIPIMMCEFSIGRNAKLNALGSIKKVTGGGAWTLLGWLCIITPFIILSYYAVIAGWTLEYIIKSASGGFNSVTPQQITEHFTNFISSPVKPALMMAAFMIFTGLIVFMGIQKGIEKYTKILMPLLFIILLILDIRAITLDGASEGLKFIFYPDFTKVTGNTILQAMGQAFYSLSLGMGIILTYGSYIGKNEDLGKSVLSITIADTTIAILAGIAIFPAVFAFNIEPNSGPGLVFITLPNVFQKIPGGYIFSTMFFILIAIAALTSTISILETVVASVKEELKISRQAATIISTITITLVGIPVSLSMGILGENKIFGKNLLDLFDFITTSVFLPVTGLLIVIFTGWFWKNKQFKTEITNEGKLHIPYYKILRFLIRYVTPVGILFVFLNGIGIIG